MIEQEQFTRAKIRLSRRQKECLKMTADGLAANAISLELGISTRMVRWHLRVARERLGAVSTSQAIHLAVKSGII